MSHGQRRLAAIMFTDMVGYTALGQRNEALSLALVEEHRNVVRPILMRHGGREVKTIGDAFLAEFPNALDAMRCAYDIQRAVREFNVSLSEDRRVRLRVGLHLGDVVESGGDISGDAVNIASRIEPLAEEGGICVTRPVYEQVQNKFDLSLISLGEKSLKNVGTPMEVFKVELPWVGSAESASFDKKRVAVLPFANISPDPSDEYFSDGMTEELIDRLCQVKELKVIARTSVMAYKNKEKKASEIARELGVGTLVEGSVRKAANKIRVTVQLINAGTEEHLWSSRYDKDLDDIFAVQSDIASKVAEALAGALVSRETSRIVQRDTSDISAYTLFLQGRQLLEQGNMEGVTRARDLLHKATELDPSFARAHAVLGRCCLDLVNFGLPTEEAIEEARSEMAKALGLDENLAEVHEGLAYVAWVADDHTITEAEARRAIELNPNQASAFSMLGVVMATKGYPNQGIKNMETAHLLDPLSHWPIRNLGQMYTFRGRDRDAEELCARNVRVAPRDILFVSAIRHMQNSDYEKADDAVKSLEWDFPEEQATVALRGQLEALRGNREEAEKSIELLGSRFKNTANANTSIGYIKLFLGDMDAFFDCMFRDVEKHTLNPFPLRYSPLLERVREDPRYREVMLRNGLDPELKE